MQRALLFSTRAEARVTTGRASGPRSNTLLAVAVVHTHCGSANGFIRCVVWPGVFTLRSNLELASKFSLPLSVLLVMESVVRSGYHSTRESAQEHAVDVQARGLLGLLTRSVQLPTKTTASGDHAHAILNDARAMESRVSHC